MQICRSHNQHCQNLAVETDSIKCVELKNWRRIKKQKQPRQRVTNISTPIQYQLHTEYNYNRFRVSCNAIVFYSHVLCSLLATFFVCSEWSDSSVKHILKVSNIAMGKRYGCLFSSLSHVCSVFISQQQLTQWCQHLEHFIRQTIWKWKNWVQIVHFRL